jgi:hypothetical protein
MIRHRDLKIEDARMCAREQLQRFGVVAPEHVDPEAFAAYLNVAVMTVKLDGADAQLIKAGKRVTILRSQRIASPVVRRFTIAHELGHLLLGHPTQIPSRGGSRCVITTRVIRQSRAATTLTSSTTCKTA